MIIDIIAKPLYRCINSPVVHVGVHRINGLKYRVNIHAPEDEEKSAELAESPSKYTF